MDESERAGRVGDVDRSADIACPHEPGERLGDEQGKQGSAGDRRTEAERAVPRSGHERPADAQHKAQNAGEQHRRHDAGRAEKGPDHRQQLDVAETHTGKPHPIVGFTRLWERFALPWPVFELASHCDGESRVREPHDPEHASTEECTETTELERAAPIAPLCDQPGRNGNEAQHETAEGNLVWNDLMIDVDKCRHDQPGTENREDQGFECEAEANGDPREEQAGDKLDCGIADRDPGTAASALCTKP